MALGKLGKLTTALARKHYSPRPIVNAALARLSVRQRLARPLGLPYKVMIEPTNACNLHCPICPTGSGRMKRPKGMMRLDDFCRIMDQLAPTCLAAQLFKDGESFLCPDIYDMIAYCRKLGIFTTASTNGNAFGKDDDRGALIDCGLDEIAFSVDGCTQETYEQYRRGGSLDLVTGAIRALAAAKRERQVHRPHIIAQFIVMKHNEHEAAGFADWARQLGADEVHVKPVYLSNPSGEVLWRDFLPTEHECREYDVSNGQLTHRITRADRPCQEVWTDLVVHWNGDVVPCCYDEEGRHAFGNVLDQSLREIWLGDEFVAFRRRLVTDKAAMPLCAACRPL
jgi:radical SAM protein with 4Fe4S-binding SPASM domain